MGNARKPTDPFPCQPGRPTERERLQAVFDVLDDYLGDTDPHSDIPWDEWDDEELKAEHPLIWCCRQLIRMIELKRKPVR